jgi:CcmD family protein
MLGQVAFLAQIATPEEILQHQYEFLSYGLAAAWVILAVYVLMMVGRERKLKREIAGLKAMLEEKQK